MILGFPFFQDDFRERFFTSSHPGAIFRDFSRIYSRHCLQYTARRTTTPNDETIARVPFTFEHGESMKRTNLFGKFTPKVV